MSDDTRAHDPFLAEVERLAHKAKAEGAASLVSEVAELSGQDARVLLLIALGVLGQAITDE